ncbi:MAG: ATP-binding cassette domain-containing protein [Candidatus Dormibacteraeota bacterium]|nr:ATP-binding cassette domain-containing protein [Candidatus Dormibacteraeota bacterium]
MPEESRIVVSGLSKVFGSTAAVQDLSFTVEPGSVTGFLGPNGAGKTTTLRVLLGLAAATAGTATIGGLRYSEIPHPSHMVGAVLEATSYHPGRTARNHLRVYCAAGGLPDRRADEVLETVGLTAAAARPVRGYSLGMRQRLGLATALLADPRVLILDEPANGLDPEGILWLRRLMRHLADERGCTVLVSSHLLSEVEQTVDRVVIIARGRLVREGTLDEIGSDRERTVLARTPTPDSLAEAVRPIGGTVNVLPDGSLEVTGADAAAVGHAAWRAGVELHQLQPGRSNLEQIFLELTADSAPAADATAPTVSTAAPPLPGPRP